MKKFLHFIQYHNFAPILFGVLVLSAGVTFAANEDARGLVIKSEQKIVSVDNTFLLGVSLDHYDFDLVVDEVIEDDTHYYVNYSLRTITLVDGVWREATTTDQLAVDKRLLRGGDLGLYIEKELAEIREAEIAFLSETQAIERSIGQNRKVVSTEYSGLFGRMLDPTTRIFPGYEPVVKPVVVASTQTETETTKNPQPQDQTTKPKPTTKKDSNTSSSNTTSGTESSNNTSSGGGTNQTTSPSRGSTTAASSTEVTNDDRSTSTTNASTTEETEPEETETNEDRASTSPSVTAESTGSTTESEPPPVIIEESEDSSEEELVAEESPPPEPDPPPEDVETGGEVTEE